MLDRALTIAEQLVAALRAHPASERVELAGSARRMTDSVKDLDVIATAHDPLALATAASQLELVESPNKPGEAGVRLRTHTGLDVDLRIVSPDQFGNLLQHFTGSKQHNMALRAAAVRKGLHVSEYGVLDDITGETHRCETEQQVYALLGMDYIEPELRENRGELEAAAKPRAAAADRGRRSARRPALPHDRFGRDRIDRRDGAGGARRGLRLPGDHRPLGGRRHAARSRRRCATTSRRSGRCRAPTRSTGSRCWPARRSTSRPTGRWITTTSVLAELDWVVASVHSSFRMDAPTMTSGSCARSRTRWST